MLSTHLIDHHLQEQLSQLLLATIYCCQALVCSSLCHEVMVESQQTVGFVQLVVMMETPLWTAKNQMLDKTDQFFQITIDIMHTVKPGSHYDAGVSIALRALGGGVGINLIAFLALQVNYFQHPTNQVVKFLRCQEMHFD